MNRITAHRQSFRSGAHHGVVSSLLALLLAAGISGPARAQDQGHGRVSMEGTIVDTPCAIDVPSRDQTIDMAAVPVGQIIRDGHGPIRPFTIRLVDCSLTPLMPGNTRPDWTRFRVTFDGATAHDQLFSVRGEARGVGLKIIDHDGVAAVPGKPMPAGQLQAGSFDLNYTLQLVGDHQSLRAGAYRTTIRFKLDYF
ncbi:TPA: fimbrial protein [Klebsiella aerogenes]